MAFRAALTLGALASTIEMDSPRKPAVWFDSSEHVTTLEDGTKVKRRGLRMRACSEKDARGRLCAGHLKRWFQPAPAVERRFGSHLYRCEKCRTIYLPNPQETPRTGVLAW